MTIVFPPEPNRFFNEGNYTIHLSAAGAQKKYIIHYDNGQWTDTDKEELNKLLSKSKLIFGNDVPVPLKKFLTKRYGSFVNELYVQLLPDKK